MKIAIVCAILAVALIATAMLAGCSRLGIEEGGRQHQSAPINPPRPYMTPN